MYTNTQKVEFVVDESGKSIPVILGAGIGSSNSNKKSEKAKQFLEELKINNATHCLIQDELIICADESGVSIFAQVVEIVARNDLSDCYVLSFLNERQVYSIHVSELGVLESSSERILDVSDLTSEINTLNEHIYVIGESPYEDFEQLGSEKLYLSGPTSKKYELVEDQKAFRKAKLSHPKQQTTMLLLGLLILFVSIGLAAALYYQHKKEKEAALARAAKIPPPLVGSDLCVSQLMAYQKYLNENIPYLFRYGATKVSIDNSLVSAEGYPHRTRHKEFSAEQVESGNEPVPITSNRSDLQLPIEGRKIKPDQLIYDQTSNWVQKKYGEIQFDIRDEFGLRNYSDYSTTLFHSLERTKIGVNAAQLAQQMIGGKRVQEGQITMSGAYFGGTQLQKIAATFLGIPSECNQVTVTRDFSKEYDSTSSPLQIVIIAKIRGRI